MNDKKILKVYGPYTSKQDGRKRVFIRFNDLSGTTKSYARFLYEQRNGLIDKNLTIDHIDEDRTNDKIPNLQPLTRRENIQKAWREGKHKPKDWFEGICSECGVSFIKANANIKHNLKQGKAGPFCSRNCAGIYGKRLQMSPKKFIMVS